MCKVPCANLYSSLFFIILSINRGLSANVKRSPSLQKRFSIDLIITLKSKQSEKRTNMANTGYIMTLANSIIGKKLRRLHRYLYWKLFIKFYIRSILFLLGVGILAMPFCFQKVYTILLVYLPSFIFYLLSQNNSFVFAFQCGILLSILLLIVSNAITRLSCTYLLKSSIKSRRKNFEFLGMSIRSL